MHTVSLVIVIYFVHFSSRICHGHDDNKRYILMISPWICQWMSHLYHEYEYRLFYLWYPCDHYDNFHKFFVENRGHLFASGNIFYHFIKKVQKYCHKHENIITKFIDAHIRDINEIFIGIFKGIPLRYIVYYHHDRH